VIPEDSIKHPAHYTSGRIEVWDFIADQSLDYFSGNVVKYICRAGRKEGASELEDLMKARAYVEKKISQAAAKVRDAKGETESTTTEGD
jgi:hypothetical protein